MRADVISSQVMSPSSVSRSEFQSGAPTIASFDILFSFLICPISLSEMPASLER